VCFAFLYLQALERSLEKEKQEAKQSRVKRQNDLKQFYDVVKKAAAVCFRLLGKLYNTSDGSFLF
jgi:hypothetical protein